MTIKDILESMRILRRSPRDITVFEDDIFIVSYPKSGNTWCRFLIGNLLSESAKVSFANIEMKVPDIYRHSNRYLLKMRRPRILKSHEYFVPRYRKVIYIIRDPRAVAVSYFYYLRDYTGQFAGLDFSSFVQKFLHGEVDRYGTWGQHVGSWHWEIRNNDSVLLLKFEDILENTERELTKMANFLGMHAGHQRLLDAIAASSFGQMRAAENFYPNQMGKARSGKLKIDAAFVREGKANSWRHVLSDSDKKMIEVAWGVLMRDFGYL